ncbi:alpha/beta fold hydrolase [Chitinimonas arctica]|uniref:Alpha/beta fold hydrolase n=1 Tax=Chitinimonas arctica TaxID=2594795 RepID=A0A516SLA7_9NEIS|nr:alpha/beta fold hydrolase [Chitinimonas arctica]QDQ28941.1 alpha/beta fold hydrolase [Chitinimonas arctica]
MKTPQFLPITIAGPVGQLETLQLDSALDSAPRGIVLVAHPNPTQGGSNTNKVVQTLAKVFSRQGYIAYCPNLRGVGKSEGEHDFGGGEVDDMAAVLDHARASHPGLPVSLAGFSFGTFVQSQLRARLGEDEIERLVLVAPATAKWTFPTVPGDTLVVHGEEDDVAPIGAVFDWARPQGLPIVVVPGAGHFFHGKLPLLADIVNRTL